MAKTGEGKVFKKIELVGVSSTSFEDAIKSAVAKASESLHGLSWFEVTEQHGKIVDGKVAEFQAVLKVAFKID
ncbi:MAG: dodecin domain-containing protein [Deltaproteobacteria bacterium]|nr:dodecin domain-containing protein [Deltaproteobacteria bacterium]